MKSDVDLGDGGTMKITPHEAHTGDKASSNVAGFLERVVCSKINDDKQPRSLVGWALGHKKQTSSLSWKTHVCVTTVRGNTVPKDAMV